MLATAGAGIDPMWSSLARIQLESPLTYPSPRVSNQVKDDGPQPPLMERRSKVRFPLELPVRYRTLARRHALAGQGWVTNMSSDGVLVTSQNEVSAGIGVELSIEWPFFLDGQSSLLQLVASGKVVRCDTSGFALLLTRHLFRTLEKSERSRLSI